MIEGWAAAAVGAAVVGSVAGAAISASGAQSAAQTQANSAANAQQISENEFNTITNQEQPYMQAGYGAQSQLDYLLGIGTPGTAAGGTNPGTASSSTAGGYGSLLQPFTAQNFQQLSPAYNFQLQQGQQGTLNADTANSGALSGSAQKDLMAYNQNMANTSFNNAFNQYQTQQGNIYSRLSGIVGSGQNAAANTGQQGTALAGQAAQSATNVGSALAAGQVGTANAYSGALQSASYLPWLYNSSGSGSGPDYLSGNTASPGSGGYSGWTGNTAEDMSCDLHVKKHVTPYRFHAECGLMEYEFLYVDQPEDAPRTRGPIAQEVKALYPEAVFERDGYLRVNLTKIPGWTFNA